MSDQWYCQRGDKRIGPMSADQMRRAYEQGKIRDDDTAWTEGMDQGQPVAQIRDRFMGASDVGIGAIDLGLDARPAPAYSPGSRSTPMEWPDRVLRAAFVAIAVGLAWGIRGSFGHVLGASFPGAILGLAFVYVCGQDSLIRRMPIVAAVSAIGIGLGGQISYGLLHGYAQSDTFINYSYGMFTLFLCGGAWGCFGCAAVGLLLERERALWIDWVGAILSAIVCGTVLYFIVFKVMGFDVNPYRSNALTSHVGASIGVIGWLLYRKRHRALRAALLGIAGFGLGMAGGRLMGNLFHNMESAFTINHWNVMEVSVGVIGGFVFAFGMLGRRYPDHAGEARLSPMQGLCIIYVMGLIPLLHRLTRVNAKRIDEWAQAFTTYDTSWNTDRLVAALTIVAALGLMAACVWMYLQWSGKERWTWFPVLALTLIMLVFQNFFARYFFYPAQERYFDMHNLYWVILVAMVGYVGWREFQGGHADDGEPETEDDPVPWLPFAGMTLGGLAFVILASAVVNGPITMTTAETRFPVWSHRDGPFPGAQSGE